MSAAPCGKSARARPVILVADDFSDARELYQEFLELEGFDVVLASNGREAVDRARETQPDLVLMDLSMPVLDGYGATEQLKEDAATRDIPVVALSGHVMPRHGAEARDAGCETVLPKPCLPTEVAAKIRSLLHASRPKTS
ncbi:MAG TPA: response regulator [Kofleriaceae bacterium]|nr:response regulator [Kofleriaceae bacterium]